MTDSNKPKNKDTQAPGGQGATVPALRRLTQDHRGFKAGRVITLDKAAQIEAPDDILEVVV